MIHQHQHLHNNENLVNHSDLKGQKSGIMKLAVSATLHCLLGCGLGEVLGMVIGTYLGISMINTMILAISLGFIFGFALGMFPFIKRGLSFQKAFKIVLVGEGIGIVVMEAFEVFTQLAIPGVIHAGLDSAIFWLGMVAALIVGFIAALPVNYYMIKRGFRHQH